jgi:hypothetical protein
VAASSPAFILQRLKLFFSVAQVIDSAHCKMPDFYIFQTPRCACGDDAVRIPHPRRSEGIAEKAHWCTGTLHMTDGFGNPR